MRTGWMPPIAGIVLLAGACDMADGRRDAGSDDSGPRVESKVARAPDAPRPPIRKLEDLDLEPRALPAASPAGDPGAVNRAWFAGRWTDTGDCAQAGLFSADGTFNLADGSRGMWNVRGGRLVVQGTTGRNELQLRRVDDDTVEVLNADGSAGRSIRC